MPTSRAMRPSNSCRLEGARHNGPAEAGGTELGWVERGQLDVGGHDRVGARLMPALNGGARAVEVARLIDDGQADVRVDVGGAMAGEMLQRGEHATRVEAADVGGRELRRRLAVRRTSALMTGLRALLLTSAIGEKLTWMPIARDSGR